MADDIRHNWTLAEAEALFSKPFNDLLFDAQVMHRRYHDPNAVQISTLISIKTGGCPEDCKYCPQSSRYDTGLSADKLMEVEKVLEAAQRAKSAGASRFCMGAAWRSPKDRDLDKVKAMVSGVKALGMETCATLGMVTIDQASELRDAGLDYYNHNIDTGEEYYEEVITTRTFEDRMNTLSNVRDAGINVCCGGIIGMGEKETNRASMLTTLANLEEHPDSVPINMLVKVPGTPFEVNQDVEGVDFVRVIAVARIMMPQAVVRLSAGREEMNDEMQALCFLAGANSIFYGEQLLTTPNPKAEKDQLLMEKLGIKPLVPEGVSIAAE
ncbi:MAG: biotin synthase BioB [Hyphomicrobiales bacterium]